MNYHELDTVARHIHEDWKENHPGTLALVHRLCAEHFTPIRIQYQLLNYGYKEQIARQGAFLAVWFIH
jgi:hypothetical protein